MLESLSLIEKLASNNSNINGVDIIDNIFCKYYLKGKSTPLVITFSNSGSVTKYTDLQSKTYSPWGFNFIKKSGFSVISFSCIDVNSWYKSDTFCSYIEQLGEAINEFQIKLGYGGSMGGYAVGCFSTPLKLQRILIFNPISTLNFEKSKWDNRFQLDRSNLDWNTRYSDSAIGNTPGYVVYDHLFNLDRLHALRYKNLSQIRVFGFGHGVPTHLKELSLLSKFVLDFINNEIDLICFYKQIRQKRGYLGYYNWLLSSENTHLSPKRKRVIKYYRNRFVDLNENFSFTDKLIIKLGFYNTFVRIKNRIIKGLKNSL
ncbi:MULTISPECIES: hypothetical protein [unclassified Pseudoalteromonas]|uniref:hypothetical protein n=1 Tax=unclassified Pseudoalteromonas TaxID=194690 RepID=UPI0004200355|nr:MULTISPECIES: hypothetical protein [unclassified Pseudoalteromonas]